MKNGLYSFHVHMLDGVTGRDSGILILRDGSLLGGGPCFWSTGSYTFGNGSWKGELRTNQHTPLSDPFIRTLSGGQEVASRSSHRELGELGNCSWASNLARSNRLHHFAGAPIFHEFFQARLPNLVRHSIRGASEAATRIRCDTLCGKVAANSVHMAQPSENPNRIARCEPIASHITGGDRLARKRKYNRD